MATIVDVDVAGLRRALSERGRLLVTDPRLDGVALELDMIVGVVDGFDLEDLQGSEVLRVPDLNRACAEWLAGGSS